MDLIDRLKDLAERIELQNEFVKTEEATKHSFILPFIAALGYNVFDPTEVIPEYTADVGIKKGEKVDYAIKKDGKIIMLMECKTSGGDLSPKHASQLYRYFNVTQESRIAVLTNGVLYRFFSDIENDNVMDDRPFLEIDMKRLDARLVGELKKLTKSQFDIIALVERASALKYNGEIKRIFAEQLEEPEDGLVEFFTRKIYSGRLTQKTKDDFRDIVRDALAEYISERVRNRLSAAAAQEQLGISPSVVFEDESAQSFDAENDGIETTEEELEAFYIVRTILRQICSPSRVNIRDAKSYCAILFDDNNRQPICRLHFNRATIQLGLFNADKKEERIDLQSLDDIYQYADRLKEVVLNYDPSLAVVGLEASSEAEVV